MAALKAFYAYEEALSHLHGKRKRATGTWQMVSRYGILPALQMRLESKSVEEALPALQELKMEDYSFQAVAKNYAGELHTIA